MRKQQEVLEPRDWTQGSLIIVTGKGQSNYSGRMPEGCLEASGGMVRRLPPPSYASLSGVSSVGNE